MARVVATLKAQNRYEAVAALELLTKRLEETAPGEPVEGTVLVTDEGDPK